MSDQADVPAPITSERDADARLVGLSFDSAPPLAAPDKNPWLVAVDGSDNALRAVAHAAHQADQMHACALHLVNVQQWFSKEAAETELAPRAWLASARARALLDAQGQPWRLHVVMGDPADQIMALAVRLGCNGVVVGNRGLGVVENLLLGSVTKKLLQLSGPPVVAVP
ncbi:universal stress protein [Rhodoferax sp.]|uniref:universal stress protein n=1 Tax=Rhodoferax sp. TaxID=50421 RepID=UPI0019DCB46A|nr:universal stress protein [Rhodoferax sp.]MBE0475028.1 universal stress protein [Rhodoferax sp.]